MIGDKEVLTHIGEIADMGRETLGQARERARDPELIRSLEAQARFYDEIFSRADAALRARGCDPLAAPKMAKAGARMMVNMQTAAAPDSDVKIAEMVIQGSAKGIAKVAETLRKYEGGDPEVRDLARRLIEAEQDHIGALAARTAQKA